MFTTCCKHAGSFPVTVAAPVLRAMTPWRGACRQKDRRGPSAPPPSGAALATCHLRLVCQPQPLPTGSGSGGTGSKRAQTGAAREEPPPSDSGRWGRVSCSTCVRSPVLGVGDGSSSRCAVPEDTGCIGKVRFKAPPRDTRSCEEVPELKINGTHF